MSTYATVNPASGQKEQEFDQLDEDGVEKVLQRSASAYESFRATDPADRARILAKTADLYEQRADDLARSITREMGKRQEEAQQEVELSSSIYRWYAEHGPDLLQTEKLDPQGAVESVVQTVPVGPLVGVMPWNYPYYQVARFVAPNLMLGNTIILKHAGICPQSALLIEEILHDAGVPEDAYINVFASTDQIADMIADSRVQGISLTGSEKAGSSVAEVAGRNLTKAVLELGGSDPFIVLDTDDVHELARTAATARLSNTGQACNSPKRFIVPEKYYDAFVDGLVASFGAAKVGDPAEADTEVGPLSSADARDTVVEQVHKAVEQGATLHTGGDALAGDGAFMAPAVLTGITPEMDAYHEEIFGPVAMVYRVESVDDAVKLANDSSFGLSGSVWSANLDEARKVADRLEVGMAYVNEHGTTLAGLPFGGVKRSGFGRELGRWGLGEFANTRLRRVAAE